jgi:hypothetical protein
MRASAGAVCVLPCKGSCKVALSRVPMRPRGPVDILVAVPALRRLLTWILVLAALALAVPAATLASGPGGSAGDQQYTDPFAGTSNPATTHTTTHTATTPAPAPATTPAPAATSTAPAPAAPAPAASTAPDTTPATSTPARPTSLAFTGYDSWLAGGLGVAMVGGGVLLRRRARRA